MQKTKKRIETVIDGNTPVNWKHHNREQSLRTAAKTQAKIKNKILVQVDHRTWVYRDRPKEP